MAPPKNQAEDDKNRRQLEPIAGCFCPMMWREPRAHWHQRHCHGPSRKQERDNESTAIPIRINPRQFVRPCVKRAQEIHQTADGGRTITRPILFHILFKWRDGKLYIWTFPIGNEITKNS